MDAFEYAGIFWPADEPSLRVAGHISYQPTGGARLKLIGSFDEPSIAFNGSGRVRRINGIAGAHEMTLNGCIQENANFDGTGLLRQDYYVPLVLVGVHLESADAIEFDSVAVEYDQLPYWLDRSSFNVSMDTSTPNDFSTMTRIAVSSDVTPRESAHVEDFDIDLSATMGIGGNRVTETHISRTPRITIAYGQRRSLDDIISDVNGIQDLLTLAMDAPAVPTLIQLKRSDLARQAQDGRAVQIPLDAYWLIFAEHVREAKPSGTAMFLSFDQVGGISTVAQWLSVSRRYRLVLGLLLSIRYSQRLYEENRLANVISAAETFHRMRFPNEILPAAEFKSYKRKIAKAAKSALGASARDWVNMQLEHSNEPRLRERLAVIAEHCGQSFGEFVGDVVLWTRIVATLRNRLTHHDPSQGIPRQPGDLSNITESVYVMVMLALLRECGISETVYSSFQQSRRIVFVRSELAETTSRLAPYLRG